MKMDPFFFCILLLLSLSGTFSKYVYIEETMDWRRAQSYCLQHYTDLAPVSNERDNQKLGELCGNTNDIWIGLIRNYSEKDKWMWSGGGQVFKFFWRRGQPDNRQDEDYGIYRNGMWHDAYPFMNISLICYSPVVVGQRKTWEEALEYCREHHDDLASVSSETELLLIQKELKKRDTTEPVWIGLHFFSGHWMWMDGQEMDYEAWGQVGKPLCPHSKMECAAFQVMGESKSVWRAQDCEERLSFICY